MNDLIQAGKQKKALEIMADFLQFDADKLYGTLKATAFKGASDEEFQALVIVANQFKLNPFLKQIYAFPAKGGGITPVIGVDGWAAIANASPEYAGVEFSFTDNPDGTPRSCVCNLLFRGGQKQLRVEEFHSECQRDTVPWRTMPRRMLRHKAFIQACRLGFGLGAFSDDDEAQMIAGVSSQIDGNAVPALPLLPPVGRDSIRTNGSKPATPEAPKQEAPPPPTDAPEMTSDTEMAIRDEMIRTGMDQTWLNERVKSHGFARFSKISEPFAIALVAELRSIANREQPEAAAAADPLRAGKPARRFS